MKKNLLFFLFVVFFSSLCFNFLPAKAQFWKKVFKKKSHKTRITEKSPNNNEIQPWHVEENKKQSKRALKKLKREEQKKKKNQNTNAEHQQKQEHLEGKTSKRDKSKIVKYPSTKIKKNYRVDILANLYLDELVNGVGKTAKNKLSETAATGIAFYQGVLIAADSLKNLNYSIDIYIHDISSKLEALDTLLALKKLDSSNLIIGAIPAQDLPTVSDFANKKNINFISAISPSNAGITGNKFFTLLTPSLKTHCDTILKYVNKQDTEKNIVLLYRNSNVPDSNAHAYLTQNKLSKNWHQYNCTALPRKKEIIELLDTIHQNIIIISVLDIVFADSILKIINHVAQNKPVDVFGMPSWSALGFPKRSLIYPNLKICITEPFDFSIKIDKNNYLETTYKNNYGGEPTEYVYRGFETILWYGHLLQQYGTIFNNKYKDLTYAPYTKFNIMPKWDSNGKLLYLENTNINFITYKNGKLISE